MKEVSLAVRKGDFVLVTGPNGAGKTTLLMSMAGAIPHYYGGTMQGMVFTDGKAVTQHNIADLASSIGVILSDYKAQIVTLTVGEEMAFTLENHGFPPEEIRRRSKEALAKVHLEGLEDRKVTTLSGGQCQRVAIARALVNDPAVILADEATGNLDTRTSFEILVLFQRLHAEGRTIIFVTHNPEIAKKAQQIIRIEDGCIIKGL